MPKLLRSLKKRNSSGKPVRSRKSASTVKPKQARPNLHARAKLKRSDSKMKSTIVKKVTAQSAHKGLRIKRLQEEMVRKGSKLAENRNGRRSPARSASLKQYESAVKLLYAQDFEKAKAQFERVIDSYEDDKELVERARIHLRLCEQKVARKPPVPRSVEEHYNLAIALYNQSRYEETFEHLKKALKYDPACDYVLYALAAASCKTGDLETALQDLQEAINLKPENRFLAQRDEDFSPLKEDSRFISMVFPDRVS